MDQPNFLIIRNDTGWATGWAIGTSNADERLDTWEYQRRLRLVDTANTENKYSLDSLGGDHGFGQAINDAMQIVGYSHNSENEYRAFVVDASSYARSSETNMAIWTDLRTFGGDESRAYDINADGTIVGWALNAE